MMMVMTCLFNDHFVNLKNPEESLKHRVKSVYKSLSDAKGEESTRNNSFKIQRLIFRNNARIRKFYFLDGLVEIQRINENYLTFLFLRCFSK